MMNVMQGSGEVPPLPCQGSYYIVYMTDQTRKRSDSIKWVGWQRPIPPLFVCHDSPVLLTYQDVELIGVELFDKLLLAAKLFVYLVLP